MKKIEIHSYTLFYAATASERQMKNIQIRTKAGAK